MIGNLDTYKADWTKSVILKIFYIFSWYLFTLEIKKKETGFGQKGN